MSYGFDNTKAQVSLLTEKMQNLAIFWKDKKEINLRMNQEDLIVTF
jgi:hypothetical protein